MAMAGETVTATGAGAGTTSGVDGSSMGNSANEFKQMTEQAFQAQMIVAQAQVLHQTKSGIANAIGQTAAQVGQDIRAAARHG
jgi:uncharacterized protein (UPF0254 family)